MFWLGGLQQIRVSLNKWERSAKNTNQTINRQKVEDEVFSARFNLAQNGFAACLHVCLSGPRSCAYQEAKSWDQSEMLVVLLSNRDVFASCLPASATSASLFSATLMHVNASLMLRSYTHQTMTTTMTVISTSFTVGPVIPLTTKSTQPRLLPPLLLGLILHQL